MGIKKHKIKNMSLRSKLLAIYSLLVIFTLCSSSAIFIFSNINSFRDEFVSELDSIARLFSAATIENLRSEDKKGAERTLRRTLVTLKEHLYVTNIIVLDKNYEVFVHYRNPTASITPEKTHLWFSSIFGDKHIEVNRDIVIDGRLLGAIQIRASTDWLASRVGQYISNSAVVLLGLLLVCLYVSYRLQDIISRPLEMLVSAVQKITRDDDYTVRVAYPYDNEIGQLSKAFNGMMKHIEQRTEDLQKTEIDLLEANEQMQKAMQNSTEAAQTKSEFLARMSHEIRTPMNAIIGMTDLLLGSEQKLTKEQVNYLEMVKTSSDSLLTIINDILDFSRIEAGMMEISPITFGIRKVLDNVFGLLSSRSKEKGIKLKVKIHPNVPDLVNCDPTRLGQVLINLIGNSIKFTPSRGVIALHVRYLFGAGEDDSLMFTIADSGVGIPENRKNEIFESFQQADSSISHKFGGTGLGLSICSSLVNMMGGEIWVESKIGMGSIFNFTIKLGAAKPVAENIVNEEVVIREAGASQANLNILLAEDNRVNQALAVKILENRGHSVTVANNGMEVIDRLSDRLGFDLILMDCQMPVMNGIDATKKIRQTNDGLYIPIIALTANAMSDDQDKCIDAGMDGYVSKPINTKKLFGEIDRVLFETSSA